MPVCLEAKELNEMKEKAEQMAQIVSAVVKLPFNYFSFIIVTYKLFIRIFLYFRNTNIKRLSACYQDGEQGCADCLNKIYKFEQQMLNNSRNYTNYKFIGWGFRKIVNTIEDRSEFIMLSANKETIETINKFIDKIEKGGLGNSNWKEQMNAL